MTFLNNPERPWRLLLSAAATLTGASFASAQVTFSIDYQSSTVSVIDGFTGTPITDGDLLNPVAGAPALGPLASPGILATGGTLGLATYGACVGHAPLVPCGIEVDALSFGVDAFVQNFPVKNAGSSRSMSWPPAFRASACPRTSGPKDPQVRRSKPRPTSSPTSAFRPAR